MGRLDRRWQGAALGIVGLAGAALVLYGTRAYGPGVTPDSAMYLAAAEGLTSGTGMVDYDGTPLVYAPPLYPALLALLHGCGLAVLPAARLFNALVFGLLVAAGTHMLALYVRQRALVVIGAVAVLAAMPLLQGALKVLSDPLFILLTILFLSVLPRYLGAPTRHRLVGLAGLGALALLQRYVGLTLVLAGCTAILLYLPGPVLQRARTAVALAVASLVPVGLWMVRNVGLTGTLTGNRAVLPRTSLPEALAATADVVTAWVMPGFLPSVLRFLLFAAGIAGLGFWFWQGHYRAVQRTHRREALRVLVLQVFVVTYLFFILVAAAAGLVGVKPDVRLLAPLYVPVLVLVFTGIGQALAASKRRARSDMAPQSGRIVVVGLLVLWLLYPVLGSGLYLWVRAQVGAGGYNVASWRASGVAASLRAVPSGAAVYSNAPGAVYFLTGRYAAPVTPGGSVPGEGRPPRVVVWFDDLARGQREAAEAAAGVLEPLAARLGFDAAGLLPMPARGTQSRPPVEAGFEVVSAFADGVVYGLR